MGPVYYIIINIEERMRKEREIQWLVKVRGRGLTKKGRIYMW